MSAKQWELLDQLLKLLQSFKEITKITSSGYSCISEVIPHIATLMRYCNKEETVKFTPKLHNVKLCMQQGLNNRFTYLKDDRFFAGNHTGPKI